MSDINQSITSTSGMKPGVEALEEASAPDLENGFLIFETKEERDAALAALIERLSSLDASPSKYGKRPLIVVQSVTSGDLAIAQKLFPKATWEASTQYQPCGESEVNN